MRNPDEYKERWFATLRRLKNHSAFQNSAACWVKLVQLAKGGGAKPPSDADIEKMAAEMAVLPPNNGPARYGNVFSIREARDGQSGELQWSVRQPDLEILVARDSDDGMMQAIRWILKDSHSKNCMLCWRDFLRGQSKDHFGSHANSCDDPLILRFPAQASCFTDKYDDFWLMRLDAASKSARAGQAPAEAALFVHESPESGSIHLAHLPVLYDAQVFWQGVDHFCANLPAPDDEVDTLEVMQKNQALQFDLISTQIRTYGTFSKEFAIPLQGMNHHGSRPHQPGDEALDAQESRVRDDAPDGASLSQLLDKQHIPLLKMRVADKAMPISRLAETGRLREADREVIDHAIGFNQNVCAVCSMASFSDSHQNVACGLRNAIRHAHYSYGAWDRRSAIESIFEAWRISESSLLAISDSVALVCLPDIDGLETEDPQWHRHFARRASGMLERVCASTSPDDEELMSHFSRIANQARHLVRNETALKRDLEYIMSSGAMEFAGSLLRLVDVKNFNNILKNRHEERTFLPRYLIDFLHDFVCMAENQSESAEQVLYRTLLPVIPPSIRNGILNYFSCDDADKPGKEEKMALSIMETMTRHERAASVLDEAVVKAGQGANPRLQQKSEATIKPSRQPRSRRTIPRI